MPLKWISLLLSIGLLSSSATPEHISAGNGHQLQPGKESTKIHNLRRNKMSKLPKRSEVKSEHRWKLEDLFADQSAWNQEYDQAKEQIKQITTFEGTLSDPAKLKACFELEDQLSFHVERLYVYANMRHHEDMAEPGNQALSDKAKKLSVQSGEATSFITPEVLSLTDNQLAAFIADPQLAPFRQTLLEMQREKAHVLSKAEEMLLAQVATSAKGLAIFSRC